MVLTARTRVTVTREALGTSTTRASAKPPCLPGRRLRLEPLEDRRLLSLLGLFSDSGQNLGNSRSMDAALGDLDGDGDLDAYVVNDGPNMVWINDGFGRFSDSGQRLGDSRSCQAALGDVDSDGDLDAVVANSTFWIFGEPNRVYLNDGLGNFTDSGQELGLEETNGVALGDLDGDGDLDAFFANGEGYPHTVFMNDAQGHFTDSGQALGTSTAYSVALGDLDGDRDLDAFVGRGETFGKNEYTEVLLNDGTGRFTDSGQRLGGYPMWDLALGDLDGDGDLDAFSCHSNAPSSVWLNDGAGHFTNSGQSLGSGYSYLLGLGDLDADGDLDAFVVPAYNQPDRVFLNDGSGIFTDSGQSLGSWDGSGGALGDLDGDGDLDAFVANYSQPDKVLVNQTKGAGITVAFASERLTTEFGLTFEFSVVLKSQPTADVTIGISSSDMTEGTVSPSTLTFTPANWNLPRTVLVTPVDDTVEDGEVVYSILIGPAESADRRYNGLYPPGNLVLTSVDDDQFVTVTPKTGLRTTELGGTDTFTVVLEWQPTADVTFQLASSDTTEGTVSPSVLKFTKSDWNVPHTVTIKGASDGEEDGDIKYSILTDPIVSSDPLYNGMDPPDVSVTNIDRTKLDELARWAIRLGGAGDDSLYDGVVDSNGNLYVTGRIGSKSTIDFDPSAWTFELDGAKGAGFVAKYTSGGGLLWAQQIGGWGWGVALDKNGFVYVTGRFEGTAKFGVNTFTSFGDGDVFVTKLDAYSGEIVWARQLGGNAADEGFDIAVDEDGNVYATGSFASQADFDPGTGVATLVSAGGGDAFVVKLDTAGNYLWAKRMGGASGDEGRGVSTDRAGNIYVTGRFGGTAEFGGQQQPFQAVIASMGNWTTQTVEIGNNVLWDLRLAQWLKGVTQSCSV